MSWLSDLLVERRWTLGHEGLGHPEDFLEAFANFYRDVADELRARRDGTKEGAWTTIGATQPEEL